MPPKPHESNQHNPALAEAITAGIAAGYEKRFAESQAAAKQAQELAEEVLTTSREGLLQAGYPPDLLDEDYSGFRDDLSRVLSWGAFDYSVKLADGTIKTVASETLQVPLVFGLHQSGDVAQALQTVRENILAMRLYRQSPDQEPVRNPDVDFARDFSLVSDIPLPGSTE